MKSNKLISVLMGIYNVESTLEEAVESIINQTYSNWELILCDDGSTDNTLDVAKKLAESDNRIKVILNEKNLGLNYTLNHCLSVASGEIIARMDGDDTCALDRFEKQIEFLISQDEYDIVSSSMNLFDEDGTWETTTVKPTPTKSDVVTGSPICHAPVMMWKKCIDNVNGYTVDKRMLRVEDVNLWIKLYTAGYKCFNIDEPLYNMRNDKNAFSRRKYKYRINSTYVRLKGCKMLHLGFKCYIKSFKPMLIGLIPNSIRRTIRKKKSA